MTETESKTLDFNSVIDAVFLNNLEVFSNILPVIPRAGLPSVREKASPITCATVLHHWKIAKVFPTLLGEKMSEGYSHRAMAFRKGGFEQTAAFEAVGYL